MAMSGRTAAITLTRSNSPIVVEVSRKYEVKENWQNNKCKQVGAALNQREAGLTA